MIGVTIEQEQTARGFARWLEDRETKRSGDKLPVVRDRLHRRIGILPGTFENLRRDRAKGARKWIAVLRAAVIRELEADIARDTHELAVLKASHSRIDQSQIEEVEAGIASLRRLLRGGDAES